MDRKIVILTVAVVAAVVLAGVATALYLNRASGDDSVGYVNMAPSLMEGWLAGNQSDAYIAWEPYVSSSVVSGTGRVIMWTNEIMPNHPCCVVAVSEDFLAREGGQDLAARFLKAHIEANRWMAEAMADEGSANYSLLLNMSAAFTLRTPEVVEEALGHVEYGYEMEADFLSALKQFTDMYVDTNIISNETLSDLGFGNVSDFIEDFVDESLLEVAGDVQPSGAILNPADEDAIRLGYLSGDIHQLAQFIAQNKTVGGGEKNLFEVYGLNVDPLPPYLNGGVLMDGFSLGDIDVGYLGAPPAIQKHANLGVSVKIIAQANSEGSGIVVHADSDIHTLEDLIGRTIATPGEATIQHLLLKIALSREGIPFLKA
ncbi:MAG: ABC transporter substrate-binding protein [Candidatus Thermoplasmatota archaeon]